MLQILPIDVRILGEEYKDKKFTGREVCDNLAISFYFNSRTHRFSSTELRNRVLEKTQATVQVPVQVPTQSKFDDDVDPFA